MKKKILQRFENAEGRVGFYYKNLITGKELGYHKDTPFMAASVIKLPIFAVILQQAALGRVSLSEKILIRQEDKMPSCGALSLFTEEVETSLESLLNLMIAISDNTATNVLIKRFTMDGLNAGFSALGLKETRINRLLFDGEAAKEGKENYFVPAELGGLLEQAYHNTLVNEEVSERFINTLLRQQINHKIPSKLPKVPIAHKTGEDSGISNDVGIVYAKQPFILCMASNETNVYEFEKLMRKTAYDCYQIK